jgi:hypothetical protein
MKTQKILLLALLFAAFAPLTHAAPLDLSAPIPVDEKLVQGTLPNGLSYYILPNQRPEQKVELRLVVKAGWSTWRLMERHIFLSRRWLTSCSAWACSLARI